MTRQTSACGCDPQLLGEIKGKQDMMLASLQRIEASQASHDARLRTVENRSVVHGAIGGLVMTLGLNLAGFFLKKS